MRPFPLLRRLGLTSIIGGLLLAPAPAHAAQTYSVNSTTDVDNATSESACTSGASGCTLRAAITDANSNAGSTINLAAGTYSVSSVLAITGSTTIVGAGSASTILDGGNSTQVFKVENNVTVTISDLTIQNGSSSNPGAAVESVGPLVINDSIFTGNTTRSASGGGAIYNLPPSTEMLTINNSVFTDNSVSASGSKGGGAVMNDGSGSLTINGSSFNGNSAPHELGGALYQGAGTGTISGSTFENNSASSGGGLAYAGSAGQLRITNSTFAQNTATSGGGILQQSGFIVLFYSTVGKNVAGTGSNLDIIGGSLVSAGSILAMGSGGGSACAGVAPADSGRNISNDSSCGLSAANQSLPASEPEFGDLGNYGGTTDTLPLLSNSPAIDAGGDSTNGCPSTDQRGATRPQGLACDIGAFEAFAPAFPDAPALGSITTGSGQLTVSWTGPAPNGSPAVTGYTISASPCNGGNATTAAALASATSATVTGLTAGTYNVGVVANNSNGSGPAASSGCVTQVLVTPTLTGLSATSGPATGGADVSITGTGFTNASAVDFGTTAASFTVVSDTQIDAVSPAAAGSSVEFALRTGSATVDVTVTALGGTTAVSSADKFAFLISTLPYRISPNYGPATGGTLVDIAGPNANAAHDVRFGTATVQAANFKRTSTNSIQVASPAGAGDVEIVLDVGGAPVPAGIFTYRPIVSRLSKLTGSGVGGGSNAITGQNLTGVTAVHVGGSVATPTVLSDGKVTFTTPAWSGPSSSQRITVPVSVDGPGGTRGAGDFTYVPPTLTRLTPQWGSPGQAVFITGKNLTGATQVLFGSSPASSFSVVSDTKITAVAPDVGGIEPVVVLTGQLESNALSFSFPPAITGIAPILGPVGATVTLTGHNFGSSPVVQVGGTPVSPVTVVSATELRFTMPSGSGLEVVTVSNNGGTSDVNNLFSSYLFMAPQITALTPPFGSLGGSTTVTLTGRYFTGAGQVMFGSTPATSFTVVNDTKITAVSPAGIGQVPLSIITPAGTAQTTQKFSYAPVVAGISPNHGLGLVTGIAILGHNFTGATGVNFGTTPASNFHVINDSAIGVTAPVPPLGTGTVDVTVVGPGGTSATVAKDQFTYGI